jgi:hypothetical protein
MAQLPAVYRKPTPPIVSASASVGSRLISQVPTSAPPIVLFSAPRISRRWWLWALIVIAVLLALMGAGSTHAQTICDFEHHCYPDGGVGQSTPNRAVTTPNRAIAPPATAQTPGRIICHLMTIREAPQLPSRIVELCSMPEDEERSIRARIAARP